MSRMALLRFVRSLVNLDTRGHIEDSKDGRTLCITLSNGLCNCFVVLGLGEIAKQQTLLRLKRQETVESQDHPYLSQTVLV